MMMKPRSVLSSKGGTDGSNNKDIDEMKKKLDELFE